jgi:hypothetical protein
MLVLTRLLRLNYNNNKALPMVVESEGFIQSFENETP